VVLVSGVEGEAPTGDPEFKKIPVVTGWFALPQKQDVNQRAPEGHRPEREAQPPDDMKEAEQNQNHPNGKGC
jgi:hypothetical protein